VLKNFQFKKEKNIAPAKREYATKILLFLAFVQNLKPKKKRMVPWFHPDHPRFQVYLESIPK